MRGFNSASARYDVALRVWDSKHATLRHSVRWEIMTKRSRIFWIAYSFLSTPLPPATPSPTSSDDAAHAHVAHPDDKRRHASVHHVQRCGARSATSNDIARPCPRRPRLPVLCRPTTTSRSPGACVVVGQHRPHPCCPMTTGSSPVPVLSDALVARARVVQRRKRMTWATAGPTTALTLGPPDQQHHVQRRGARSVTSNEGTSPCWPRPPRRRATTCAATSDDVRGSTTSSDVVRSLGRRTTVVTPSRPTRPAAPRRACPQHGIRSYPVRYGHF